MRSAPLLGNPSLSSSSQLPTDLDPFPSSQPVCHEERSMAGSHDEESRSLLLSPSLGPLPTPSPNRSWTEPAFSVQRRSKLREAWLQSKGMALVLLAQFFGASMNVMTKILEIDGSHGPAMDPFQVLFARMSITVIFSYLYMWYMQVAHPFGTWDLKWLLIARAVGGFFGVFGFYYSIQYMPLSEATVLTFLAPVLACYACSFLIPHETFTRKQQLAGLVSLIGVVLIAQPFSLAPQPSSSNSAPAAAAVDSYHHILATAVALLGVLGAAIVYTAIRMVGSRAHALVTVTYFSSFTAVVSALAMAVVPSIAFRLPGNVIEWSLLVALGVCGFILQFLMTAGLAYEPPPPSPPFSLSQSRQPKPYRGSGDSGVRATSMVYTQMLFALLYDKIVWGIYLSVLSWAGSGLILASAIYVAVVRDEKSIDYSRADELDEARMEPLTNR